jgi:hypothetical protein
VFLLLPDVKIVALSRSLFPQDEERKLHTLFFPSNSVTVLSTKRHGKSTLFLLSAWESKPLKRGFYSNCFRVWD